MNLGFVMFPLIIGYIYDHTTAKGGYFWISIFSIVMSLVVLILCIILYIVDVKGKKLLGKS